MILRLSTIQPPIFIFPFYRFLLPMDFSFNKNLKQIFFQKSVLGFFFFIKTSFDACMQWEKAPLVF